MWKKRTSKHTFSPNVEKGSQVMAMSIWAWTSPGSFAHARSPCIVKHLFCMQASWSRQTTAKVAAALSECFEWHILKNASVVPLTSARVFCSFGGSNISFFAHNCASFYSMRFSSTLPVIRVSYFTVVWRSSLVCYYLMYVGSNIAC